MITCIITLICFQASQSEMTLVLSLKQKGSIVCRFFINWEFDGLFECDQKKVSRSFRSKVQKKSKLKHIVDIETPLIIPQWSKTKKFLQFSSIRFLRIQISQNLMIQKICQTRMISLKLLQNLRPYTWRHHLNL